MNLILASAAGLVSGILGSMGMGGGGVLIIYLALFSNFDKASSQGINLIFFIPSALIATLIYWRKNLVEWRIILPICIPGIIGVILGTYTSSFIETGILRKLFGLLLLFMSIKQFRSNPQKKKH